MTDNKQYPELPTHFMLVQESFRDEVYLYTADQMRAYVDADRAMRAAPAPAAQGDAEDAADAARYRCWRDAMIEDVGLQFTKAVSGALPDAVGASRRPTAHEWDAAVDAARSQAKEGANHG